MAELFPRGPSFLRVFRTSVTFFIEVRTSLVVSGGVDCDVQFCDPYTLDGILSYFISRRCMVDVRIKLFMVIVGLEVFMVRDVRLISNQN